MDASMSGKQCTICLLGMPSREEGRHWKEGSRCAEQEIKIKIKPSTKSIKLLALYVNYLGKTPLSIIQTVYKSNDATIFHQTWCNTAIFQIDD
jgi:hypothetical protein